MNQQSTTGGTSFIDSKDAVRSSTYRFETCSKLRVQKMYFENHMHGTVKITFLGNEFYEGPDRYMDEYLNFQVEILEFGQTAKDSLNQLMADINTVTGKVILRTDMYGSMYEVEVVNVDEILLKWQQLKPSLLKKYRHLPKAQEFMDAFERQIDAPEELDFAVENKGVYGILLAGVYGRTAGETFNQRRTIHDYFSRRIDLPYKTTHSVETIEQHILAPSDTKWSTIPQWKTKRHTEIRCLSAAVDEASFDENAFNTLIKTLADSVVANRKLAFTVQEDYRLDAESGWITDASQTVRTETAGFYMNEQKHTLTLLKQ